VIQWILLWGTIFGLSGVALVAVTNKAVTWSSSDAFCGTFCHTMTWSSAAYHQGPHFINAAGVRASCGQCHIPYDSSHATATEYVKLLLFKADRGAKDFWNESRKTIATKENGKSNDRNCERSSKAIRGRTITLPVVVAIRSKRLADRGAA
jgi:nitrate/TMAO reductase-like tetraheme cytochrome c subunit